MHCICKISTLLHQTLIPLVPTPYPLKFMASSSIIMAVQAYACVCISVCVCILKSVYRLKYFQIFLLFSQNTKLNILLVGIFFLRHVFLHKYQNSHWKFIPVVTVVDGVITLSSVFVGHEYSN